LISELPILTLKAESRMMNEGANGGNSGKKAEFLAFSFPLEFL
jgi:hypothetical protein